MRALLLAQILIIDDYDCPIFEYGCWLFSDRLIEISKSDAAKVTYCLQCLSAFKKLHIRLMMPYINLNPFFGKLASCAPLRVNTHNNLCAFVQWGKNWSCHTCLDINRFFSTFHSWITRLIFTNIEWDLLHIFQEFSK